jgi:hypothetical protein
MIRIPGSGQGYAKTISVGLGLAEELCSSLKCGSYDFVGGNAVEAVVAAHRHGVPLRLRSGQAFDFVRLAPHFAQHDK